MKTLNQLYKTLDSCAPFNGDAEKRAKYLEQCLKHIMAIAKNGCKEKRIIETVEESIGWLTPHETAFAVDYVQNMKVCDGYSEERTKDDHTIPVSTRHVLCGWRGMAGGQGCILPLGHTGGHGFQDGSGSLHNAESRHAEKDARI